MSRLKDDSLMPFGKYQGTKMANVPAGYLLFLWRTGKCTTEVNLYIWDHLAQLEKEDEKQNRGRN